MKIPFDADEFGKRLDSAFDTLNKDMVHYSVYSTQSLRLADKIAAVKHCIDIHDSHSVDFLAGYLAAVKPSTLGLKQGYDLVRGYLNEYEWSGND